MTLAIRRVRLRAVTGDGTFGADVELHRGLTVINAPNTSGKSTITQAILYGLGLEATLGPQRDVPLPHAMTHTLNDDGVERPVLESQVILEVETGDGSALTVRRYVKHPNIDQRLISVWRGSLPEVETGEGQERMDFFVRDPGAAQREAGFHRFLADELGWSLPEVPKFSGGAALLYIEAVVPLFFVEQKRGWGGVQAVVPTQFQIRDVRRRSLEFLLGLDVQERATRIDALRTRLRDLTADWAERCGALKALTTTIAASIDGLPSRPTAEWPLEVPPTVRVATSTSWESLDAAIVENRQALSATLRRDVPNVGDEAPSAERQLVEMENELRRLGALASENVTQEELEEATSRDARGRLAAIDEDIRRHADLEKLRDFGSTLEVRLHRDHCPTCHQTFPDVLLETEDAPRALGISGSLALLRQRRALLVALVNDADRVVEARRSRTRALRSTARDLRASIRAIKDTLVSPSSQPSIASVQRRLQLESRVTSLTSVSRVLKNL